MALVEDEGEEDNGAGRWVGTAFIDERSWRLKLSRSSPVSCKNMHFRLLHGSLRRYAEQYLVVPY